jgi:hypothetical protein
VASPLFPRGRASPLTSANRVVRRPNRRGRSLSRSADCIERTSVDEACASVRARDSCPSRSHDCAPFGRKRIWPVGCKGTDSQEELPMYRRTLSCVALISFAVAACSQDDDNDGSELPRESQAIRYTGSRDTLARSPMAVRPSCVNTLPDVARDGGLPRARRVTRRLRAAHRRRRGRARHHGARRALTIRACRMQPAQRGETGPYSGSPTSTAMRRKS